MMMMRLGFIIILLLTVYEYMEKLLVLVMKEEKELGGLMIKNSLSKAHLKTG